MSKLSDFFKTKSGMLVKVAVTSAMTVNVANAASDAPTYDERTGYENLDERTLDDMNAKKLGLQEVIDEMGIRVAHCELVASKMGDALSGMYVINGSKGFTSAEKLEVMGKIADGILNDPVNFHEFSASLMNQYQGPEISEHDASASGSVLEGMSHEGSYVEILPEDLKSAAAEVLDKTTVLIGEMQQDIDVCIDAVTKMMGGYNTLYTHADTQIDDPEGFLFMQLDGISQAYHRYVDYVEHSFAEDYTEMRARQAEETDGLEERPAAGMRL